MKINEKRKRDDECNYDSKKIKETNGNEKEEEIKNVKNDSDNNHDDPDYAPEKSDDEYSSGSDDDDDEHESDDYSSEEDDENESVNESEIDDDEEEEEEEEYSEYSEEDDEYDDEKNKDEDQGIEIALDDVLINGLINKINEKVSKNTKDDKKQFERDSKDFLDKLQEKSKEHFKIIDDDIKKDLLAYYFNSLNSNEKKYFVTLSVDEQIVTMSSENSIIKSSNGGVPLRFKVLKSCHNENIKDIVLRKVNLINSMHSSNSEKAKLTNWIESFCRIPFGVYRHLPVNYSSSIEDKNNFIDKMINDFDNKIYGHKQAKNQIIRIIAQWISNPNARGNVIGIHGQPGVGKTTLVKDCICSSLQLPFQFIPLGGSSDGSNLEGHHFTYEGSTYGKIADCLIQSKCMNPVLYFDELDKISDSSKGQEIVNILIHLTDPSQNSQFYDKYFNEIPIDLSKCLIVFTYNNDNLINPILKDRMIRIETKGYTINDKTNIVKDFMLKEMLDQFSLNHDEVKITDNIIQHIIEKTENEGGVRNLRRSLEYIISNINLARMTKHSEPFKKIQHSTESGEVYDSILPLNITGDVVDYFLKSSENNSILNHMYM